MQSEQLLSQIKENEMRKIIQCAALTVAVVLASVTVWAGPSDANVERDRDATQVAKAWFTSLMQGESAVTTSLSAVPFSFDRKQEVKTLPELTTLYKQVADKNGKRDLKVSSVKIATSSPEKVEVVLMIEDEGIAVTIKPGEAFRVVGFSD
jgi:hypothetical protein